MSKNRHGLDTGYIGKNLDVLHRDIENYTPAEMGRALRRLADVAKKKRAVSKRAVNNQLG
jgi:hypothetical protein